MITVGSGECRRILEGRDLKRLAGERLEKTGKIEEVKIPGVGRVTIPG